MVVTIKDFFPLWSRFLLLCLAAWTFFSCGALLFVSNLKHVHGMVSAWVTGLKRRAGRVAVVQSIHAPQATCCHLQGPC
jgi:hypothetical protein